jgi:hypothetical protein
MKYTLLLLLLVGCTPAAPGANIEDPRAYLLKQVPTLELNSWIAPYRITEPAFVDAALDAAIKTKFRKKGLPNDQRKLDTFAKRQLAASYRAAHLKTPESRALVLANVKARYAQPPMAVADKGRVALLDFGAVPGAWKKGGRASTWGLRPTLPNGLLPQADLQRGLKALVAKHPKAQIYELRYQFIEGLGEIRARLVYDRVPGVLWRAHGQPRTYATVAIDDLLAGTAAFATLGFTNQAHNRANPTNAAFPSYKAPKSF